MSQGGVSFSGGTDARTYGRTDVRTHGRTGARRYVVGALALVLVAVLTGVIALARNGAVASATDPSSVAVLPLREIGASGRGGEGERVTEELTTALARLAGLTVRSASRAGDAVERGGDVDRIGRRLGVAFVVDGGVQRGSSRLRVTLRLVRTSDAVSVWAGTYDADAADPITAAQQVATAASREIGARLARPATRADTTPR